MAKIHYKESGKRMARNEAVLSKQNEYGNGYFENLYPPVVIIRKLSDAGKI